MDISIVIPAYNEEANAVILYNEVKAVLDRITKDYEIIFIDDGSVDKTYANLKAINSRDKRVRIIKFRKNFGQTAAMDAGFKASKGKIIVAMDADLQNDPKDIPKLLAEMKKGYDVVSGWRHNRKDPISKKLISLVANILRKMFTREVIHDSGCSLKAYKKECFNNMNLYGEMHRFIPALLMWKGFKVGEAKVNHRPRKFGKTKYSLNRVIKGSLDLLVVLFWQKYSTRPIHLFGALGLLTGLIGIVIGAYLSVLRLFYGVSIGNRPLLLLAFLFMIIGVQFIIFGLMSDILIKNYYRGNVPYNIEKEL